MTLETEDQFFPDFEKEDNPTDIKVESKEKSDKEIKINFKKLIGEETINWLKGSQSGKPEGLKQLGEDFAVKMNWYLGCTVLAQYARIPELFEALDIVSEKIFNIDDLRLITDQKELHLTFDKLSREINSVMNFAQRYVTQNKDLLIDNTNFFERQLFEKIKSMSIEQIKGYLSLFHIIDIKGQQTLDEIIEKYK